MMPIQSPMQAQGGMSGNLMSGLPPDIMNKVLKSVTKTVSDTVSMQAQEAISQGVPWGHVLQELVKMAPPGANLSGGGNQPPGGGMPGGDQKPPQPPQGGVKQDSLQQQPTQDLNQLMTPQGQGAPAGRMSPMGQAQMAPQPGMQAPMPMAPQQGGGGINPLNFLFQQSSVNPSGAYKGASMLGGLFKTSGQDALASQQALNLQPDLQVNLEQRKANEVPLGIADKEKIKLEGDARFKEAEAKYATENLKTERERMTKFFDGINQPLSTAKELSLVESAMTGIDDVTNILGISADQSGNVSVKNEKLLRDVNFLKKNTQALKRARDLYINKTLRRDSGAAIGKKEENDFKDIVGFDIGLKAFMQNPKVIAKAILESRDQLGRDRNRLSPNEKQRTLVSGLRDRGFKDAEIYDYLKRTGEV